jgi:uncharacterized protein
MPKEYLPKHVDLTRFAENGADISGFLPLANMQRLADSLIEHEGEVKVNVHYGVDRNKIKFLKGALIAPLKLQCQRCLGSFVFEINGSFAYGIVTTDDEAKTLPEHYDPLVVKDDNLNVSDMVEEEIIVNLPIVPMHDPADCIVKLPIVVVEEHQAKKENPFKVIESLKIKSNKDN